MDAGVVLIMVVVGAAVAWVVWARISSSRRGEDGAQPAGEGAVAAETAQGVVAETVRGGGAMVEEEAGVRPPGLPPSRGGRRGRGAAKRARR